MKSSQWRRLRRGRNGEYTSNTAETSCSPMPCNEGSGVRGSPLGIRHGGEALSERVSRMLGFTMLNQLRPHLDRSERRSANGARHSDFGLCPSLHPFPSSASFALCRLLRVVALSRHVRLETVSSAHSPRFASRKGARYSIDRRADERMRRAACLSSAKDCSTCAPFFLPFELFLKLPDSQISICADRLLAGWDLLLCFALRCTIFSSPSLRLAASLLGW